jgi:endoglucanase
VADAQGFVLNVSNFVSSAENAAYGAQVAALADGKHFVIDTSRNGLGPAPDGAWCNPPGRALGLRPTDATGVSRQDASLWIKHPGESDGPCNGGPAAGQWWADAALGLAQRAAF